MLRDFVDAGLGAGDRLSVHPSRLHDADRLVREVLGGLCDMDTLIERGQLVLGAAEDVYLSNGCFDPDARIDGIRTATAAAVDDGFSGLSVYGEVGWLAATVDPITWDAYEVRADLLSATRPFSALCDYRGTSRQSQSYRPAVESHRASACQHNTDQLAVHGTGDGGVALVGELDAAVADHVRAVLIDALRDVPAPLIDLRDLRFVDGAGTNAIFEAASATGAKVTQASRLMHRIWGLLGFDDQMPLGEVTT